jgi:hypothetical protein
MQRFGYKDALASLEDLLDFNHLIENEKENIRVHRNRNKGIYWVKEPKTGLYIWSTIPERFIKKYNLPNVEKVIDLCKLQQSLEIENTKNLEIQNAEIEIRNALRYAFESDFSKFCPKYHTHYPNNPDKVIELAKLHSVYNCCLILRKVHTIALTYGGYMQTLGSNAPIKTEFKFGRKLKEQALNGICLVHKSAKKPRKYLVKLTDWHIAKIEFYYSHGAQYTHEQIHDLLTHDSKLNKKEIVSFHTVSKYLSKIEVKNRLSIYRNPEYWKKEIKPFTRREKPNYAFDLWYADGSPIQITSWNKNHTKVTRLNLFIVIDVKSLKIVGFDVSEQEDRYNWFAALKMAVSLSQAAPFELMYDNASATKTNEFKTIKNDFLIRGTQFSNTTKAEPQQKADVERTIQTLQSFMRMIDGFIGEGIRSKRENGRIDAEHLSKIAKKNGFYSYESMVLIITDLISIYNSKQKRGRRSPNQIFTDSEKPNAVKLNAADIAMLFWHHKILKVRRSEITFEIRKNPYYYNIYNHELALQLDGTEVKVYYDENDLSKIHIFKLNNEYLGEIKQKVKIVSAKANQTENDVLEIIKQTKHHENKAKVAKQITKSIIEKGMMDDEEGFLQQSNPYIIAKADLNDAESKAMINYVYENAGLDLSKVEDYKPFEVENIISKQVSKSSLEQRHSKKHLKPATLEIVSKR